MTLTLYYEIGYPYNEIIRLLLEPNTSDLLVRSDRNIKQRRRTTPNRTASFAPSDTLNIILWGLTYRNPLVSHAEKVRS